MRQPAYAEASPGSAQEPRLLLLGGPTAVGKSEIALELAQRLHGEIISVDSMQVYRGLDLGTAKPSPAQRARAPHHLLDVVELAEPFDAAQFVQRARQAIAEIRAHGALPILCGGTGLYFKAFLQGLGEAPPTDPRLRAQLEATPLPELLRELQQGDPLAYERIDRQNPRRVFRAVEVLRLTGKPFSSQRADWPAVPAPARSESFFCFARSPADLHQRIDRRVEAMFQQGLVAETEQLLARGLASNRIALQALGYRQVVEHLNGLRPLDQTIELVKSRTRLFAKRQMTWFRRQLPVRWIDLAPDQSVESAAERVLKCLTTPPKSPTTSP